MSSGQLSDFANAPAEVEKSPHASLSREVFGVRQVESDPTAVREQVQAGLAATSLDAVQASFEISQQELARLLGVGAKTIARLRKGEGRLGVRVSDRVARLVRVFDQASRTLGEQERAKRWLATSNAALGGNAPRVWLDTDVGTQEVIGLLGRIEHGVFS